jgi:DnaK suppressor protein
MPAVLPTRTDAVAPTAPNRATDVRLVLEDLAAECLHARAEAMAALAEDRLDPVLPARIEGLDRTLEDIRAALGRIDAGTYGRCVTCGGAIPAARLEVRPFADSCVPCAGAVR